MLKQILTWPLYLKYHKPPPPKVDVKETSTTYQVDGELNDKVSLWQGDITKLDVDAIVNAANSSLLGGGGVDGSIHRAAGKKLKELCSKLGGCATGEAKITPGFELTAKNVIHTVGPMDKSRSALENCYINCYKLMIENKLRTIAFPCISTGVYGYPNEDAAHVALSKTREFLTEHKDKVDRIIFCTFLDVDTKIYGSLMQHYFPVAS